jgi:hypothetical protein
MPQLAVVINNQPSTDSFTLDAKFLYDTRWTSVCIHDSVSNRRQRKSCVVTPQECQHQADEICNISNQYHYYLLSIIYFQNFLILAVEDQLK